MSTLIIGAGPAGLTAAYELTQHGWPVMVLEQDPIWVGGISRTVTYKGYRFDIGGHRFFSKSAEIEQLWTDWLGAEMLTCQRLSRIYYRHTFFDYPIRPLDVFAKLGLPYTSLCVLSYLQARLMPRRPVVSFEDWVINQFGERLFQTFFKTYTEKVWGIPCDQISADWAAQRIKGLSMVSLIRQTLLPQKRRGDQVIKTLIDQFRYPRLGPGQMWEHVRDSIEAAKSSVLMDHKAVSLRWNSTGIFAIQTRSSQGQEQVYGTDQVISSMPIQALVSGLQPAPPDFVIEAANRLTYRDFLTVALILDQPHLFPDNWIYIHDASVQVGRIQNFKNWSLDLVPIPETTCLGLEYFCFTSNQLWNCPDADLIELATHELGLLGLAGTARVIDGTVVRVPKAYPVYDHQYQQHVNRVRTYLAEHIPNLQLIGRNGMHRYNNQDHAMMTGLLAARNLLAGEYKYDLWQVNQDAAYLEEGQAGEGRGVPQPLIKTYWDP